MAERAVNLFLFYASTPWGKLDLLHSTRRIARDGLILNSAFASSRAPLFSEARGSHIMRGQNHGVWGCR